MTKIEQLIKAFIEFKEQLNKQEPNTIASASSTLGSTATAGGTSTINSQIGNPFGKKDTCKAEANPKPKTDPKPKKPSGNGGTGGLPAEVPIPFAQSEMIKLDKNGQWKLHKMCSDITKLEEKALPAESHEPDSEETAVVFKPHPISGQRHVVPIHANATTPTDEHSSVRTKTVNVEKVDPEENINIPHPKKKAKMARDSIKSCKKCKSNPCECIN